LRACASSSAIPQAPLPYWLDYSVDARMLATLIAVSSLSAALFGLVPAFLASRTDIHAV
jgi:hypothetical protein